MCRYAMSGPYKQKWACFGCRRSFRQARGEAQIRELKCPRCKSPMHLMGLDFKPPRQSDEKGWKKVELLFRAGFGFSSCGCNGPGERPRRLREVPEFLSAQAEAHENWARMMRRQRSEAALKVKRRDAEKARAWKAAEKA